jgi:transcriptional regulator with XRE-family HTH domain
MNIGKRIKEIRTSKNIKSIDLAKKAGITSVYLSYIEAGEKIPTLETLEKICDALGITLAELFTEDLSDMPPEVIKLIQEIKNFSPEQIKSLIEFLKTLK